MTPSEELRAAATRLRELAASAIAETSVEDWYHEWLHNDWIAAMSPAVAEPLAKLLGSFVPLAEFAEVHGGLGGDTRGYEASLEFARLILEAKP